MYIRTLKSFAALAGVFFLLAMCTKSDKDLYSFSAVVHLDSSSLAADELPSHELGTLLYYSTDGGKSFSTFPVLSIGQTYLVKVQDKSTGAFLVADNCFTTDWSASTPKPNNVGADVAEFTMEKSNHLVASVTDHYSPYDASSWTGKWTGVEDGACCGGSKDPENIRQDPSNPNKFIMDNFWYDGVDAYFIMNPSTSLKDQTINMPTQTTADPGVASGTGTYDQCHGTFVIATTYVIGGKTYTWNYEFSR